MAVLDDAPRSATATAEIYTRTLFVERHKLLKLVKRRPEIALSIIREFSARMRNLNQKYVNEIVQAERLAARRPWLVLWAAGAAHWLATIHWLRLPHPATALGWLVFAAVPDGGTLLGAAVIIGSGLYTVHRERVRARERAAVRR
jgi:hypothetical protein